MHGFLVKATIPGANQREFRQSIDGLSEEARREYQVAEWSVSRNVEADDELMVVASWDEREGLERYLLSENFRALLGAIGVLGCLIEVRGIETSPLSLREAKEDTQI